MKEPNTIKEVIELLQRSVASVLPGINVSVSISLSPANEQAGLTVLPGEMPISLAKEIDLAALRNFLNAYAKKAGAKKAITIVQKYTGSDSKNPVDINPEKYQALVDEIAKECPGMEISFTDKDAA